jgi:hypothetical protein
LPRMLPAKTRPSGQGAESREETPPADAFPIARGMFNYAIPFHIADSIYCDTKCRIENGKRRINGTEGECNPRR